MVAQKSKDGSCIAKVRKMLAPNTKTRTIAPKRGKGSKKAKRPKKMDLLLDCE
jgi:hypothetical protein